MSKKYFYLFFIFLVISNTQVLAASRVIDFNSTSDLTNYFNSDGDPKMININYGGLNLSGSIDVNYGYEDIWTSKKGYNVSGIGNVFKTSGYFRNEINSGYGSIGFTNSSSNSGDGLGSPNIGIGIVFHGGGGYFVNNGMYTDINWPPDLELDTWYKFEVVVEKKASNKFDLTILVYKSDEAGSLLTFKTTEYLEVTNVEMANSNILYSYFGTAQSRFGKVDHIFVELSGGATFEEDGKPILITYTISNISKTSADVGGEVTSEMGSSVTQRGVCYSISPNPTTSGTCTANGTGTGSFSSNISGLSENTTYYVRAFATNANGTGYGNQNTFRTLGNSQNLKSSIKNVFKKMTKCSNKKPPKITWAKLTSVTQNGKKLSMLNWSQIGADKITIKIDNGTGKFPYTISRTRNDGREILPNVSVNQKIKIIAHNGCRSGDEQLIN